MIAFANPQPRSGPTEKGHHVRRRLVPRLRATLFTLGVAAAAMVLVVPSAAAAATTTTVSAQGTPATTCPVTLTANVTPIPAGGTVEFKEGAATLGAAAPVTNGTATVNHTFTTTGAHIVFAKFSGFTGFDTSTSANLTVNVTMGLNLGSVCLPLG
ncbi:Ig-like domain-containing protein [Rhodococcus sp. NPDC127530]|uniref:Ig-like domain-containing protein n=1 Tax=unclassified Rhodococcus (in: high G+C Gram-positive bacteria) TaxID=192944 RepID=UPI003639B684